MKTLSLVLFGVLGIVWGSNFIYMKLAVDFISPSQIVLTRVVFGFIPVLIYALIQRSIKISHIKHIARFCVMALLATVIYYYSYAKGTALLFSGVAGAVSASIPIFSFVLACLFLAEKISFNTIIGIGAGCLGVMLIARPFDSAAMVSYEGILYMLLGSLSVGASFIFAKKYVTPLNIPASALTTYQLGLGIIILLIFTDVGGVANVFDNTHVALGVIIGLGMLGTGLAYIIYYHIVDNLGAVAASSSTYLPPVVALAIGAFIADEDIGGVEIAATILILSGVILINRQR